MKGVVALVTGAAGGLGRATAVHLARNGARVVVADLAGQADMAAETVSMCGEGAVYAATDVTDEAHVSGALDTAESTFGEPVNCAVNCAGIVIGQRLFHPKKGPHGVDRFHKIQMVNVFGTFNVSRLAAERMNKREVSEAGERGVIINTASVAAFEGQIGQVAYSASKGAIVGMTMPMARDLGSIGVRVNTIAPGVMMTPMMESLPEEVQVDLAKNNAHPKRLGNASEYAMLVESIVRNPFLNGETIRLDAGLRMTPK